MSATLRANKIVGAGLLIFCEVFRRVNHIIEAQPYTSRVAKKCERKHQSHNQQNHVDGRISYRKHQQREQIREENQGLGSNDVDVNRAYEIALLAREDHMAVRAFVVHFQKRPIDPPFAAGRTAEL